jgi:hypothetical protein
MKKTIILLAIVTALYACGNLLAPPTATVITKGIADKLDVGESAQDLLSKLKYTRLNIEIQFAPGMRPQDRSVDDLLAFFKTYTDKPGGVTVTLKQVGSIGKTQITTQDADSFAVKNRVLYTGGDLLSLYIYFADAVSAKSWIGGVAYRNTSVVVFEKTILENTKGQSTAKRIKIETGVLEHEVGHLLGLVNNGTPMLNSHEDAAHKFHCTNRNCLMYHAMEAGLVKSTNDVVPVFDAACIKDLQAFKDK